MGVITIKRDFKKKFIQVREDNKMIFKGKANKQNLDYVKSAYLGVKSEV